ncbi:MAG: type I phosphomannose isomerase catalytic subunit [Lutibacter sp.]|uniref:type I phosphomannose isomerase catalytic subunit n=1 Tax=Lutibacter sp. TaxID=1925666 RepID=UPI00299D2F9C|nr:type I phosphomannose isomerase catalytic subunit [Lutibacter sp.]MDX1828284.1 type I phosphomannose isomerase catalytic subunit [Lutibacter sp.]
MLNYALKFKPILKQKIWGGNKLVNILHKESKDKNIGESWEISGVDCNVSIVANGKLKGVSLKELVQKYKGSLVGDKNYQIFNDKFPLLIKFIDASQDLSVQVHPNNELAKKRHNSFGKTEMWYIMEAEANSNLVLGFSKSIASEEYKELLKKKSITSVLNLEKIKKGDVFFIETGTVHAIGAGVVLAEIQQTSDITYRIYDWDRVDDQGKSRELHTDLAIDAINFSTEIDAKQKYGDSLNELNSLVSCPYFRTNFIPVKGNLVLDYTKTDSFVIFMCVEGFATIIINNNSETINYGETILIPANTNMVKIDSENCKLLEVTV